MYNLTLDFVSEQQESELIQKLDELQDWDERKSAKERNNIWRFGNYRHTIVHVCPIIPDYLLKYCDLLHESGLTQIRPDSVQVNEYLPGQGVSPHVDSRDNGELITILTVSGHTVLKFLHPKKESFSLYVPRRSLFQMWGETRYEWQHTIEPRTYDIVEDVRMDRTKRYSIVFRKFVLGK